MNIFQRIKEVKLPFFAVIAALVFGGVVAPANAAAPVISNVAVTPADTSATILVTVDQASTCKALVRLAADAAATRSDIDMFSPPPTGLNKSYITMPQNTSPTATATGLTVGNTYVAYVICTNSGFETSASAAASASFTTVASGPTATNITVSGVGNSGATISFTQSLYGSGQGCMAKLRLTSSAAYTASQVLDYNQSSLASSSWINSGNSSVTWSITGKSPGTNYTADIACKDQGTNSQVYTASFTTTGTAPSSGSGSGGSSSRVTQRPLPKISFATNPAPGFSVRPTSDTRKGTLTLQGENFSDLTAITIAGKKADFTVKDGKLEIKLPAGVTGFPEVVMTNAGGSITMQNAIEIFEHKVQKLTRFVGDRFTKAGLEVLENACIDNKDATSIEAIVVVAADANEADYANAVKAATDAASYLDKVSKRISHTSVTVAKTGAAGSKPVVEMNFTKQ